MHNLSVEAGGIWYASVPSTQFRCESKSVLKFHGMWNFPKQGSVCAPCSGSVQAHLLESQESPRVYLFKKRH